jgi:hypothetical protein
LFSDAGTSALRTTQGPNTKKFFIKDPTSVDEKVVEKMCDIFLGPGLELISYFLEAKEKNK